MEHLNQPIGGRRWCFRYHMAADTGPGLLEVGHNSLALFGLHRRRRGPSAVSD
jgi:hypothetical protein